MPPDVNVAALAEVAATLSDMARLRMVVSLLGGVTMNAKGLAEQAGITPQTASAHLAKLVDSGLVARDFCGRQRIHRVASGDVVALLDLMSRVSPRLRDGFPGRPEGVEPELRAARVCHDHMAGRLAAELASTIVDQDGDPSRLRVAAGMRSRLQRWGLNVPGRDRVSSHACACEDWTERRPHLAGSLGACILTRSLELDWVRRREGSRALLVTHVGRRGFKSLFGVSDR